MTFCRVGKQETSEKLKIYLQLTGKCSGYIQAVQPCWTRLLAVARICLLKASIPGSRSNQSATFLVSSVAYPPWFLLSSVAIGGRSPSVVTDRGVDLFAAPSFRGVWVSWWSGRRWLLDFSIDITNWELVAFGPCISQSSNLYRNGVDLASSLSTIRSRIQTP